jgi:hypothetical protein
MKLLGIPCTRTTVTNYVSSQFSLGSEEDLEPALPFTSFHMESEQHLPPEKATLAKAEEVVVEEEEEEEEEEEGEQQQEVRDQPEDEEGDEESNNRWVQ